MCVDIYMYVCIECTINDDQKSIAAGNKDMLSIVMRNK